LSTLIFKPPPLHQAKPPERRREPPASVGTDHKVQVYSRAQAGGQPTVTLPRCTGVYSSICHGRAWFHGCVLGPCTTQHQLIPARKAGQGRCMPNSLDTGTSGAHRAELPKLPGAFLRNFLRKSVHSGNRKSLALQTGSSTQFCIPRTYHEGGWCSDGTIQYHQG